ncbi:MAG: hypothetical protein ABJH26_11365, partial [Marinomonas sp.]
MRLSILAAGLLASSALIAAPAYAESSEMSAANAVETGDLSFERVFASPSLNGASPRQAKLSPDGRYLTVLRNRSDDLERYDLWGFDREAGEWT